MQFVADENVSHRVVERLRADGHDVMLVAEVRSGMPDTDVLKLADTETCILVTEGLWRVDFSSAPQCARNSAPQCARNSAARIRSTLD